MLREVIDVWFGELHRSGASLANVRRGPHCDHPDNRKAAGRLNGRFGEAARHAIIRKWRLRAGGGCHGQWQGCGYQLVGCCAFRIGL